MRRLALPVFTAALILAYPVQAQAKDHAPESAMTEKLSDPAFQDNLVSMMTGFMGAMMELPIGEFAHAIDGAIPPEMKGDSDFASIDRDSTLGELARRDDPHFERDIEDRMREGTAMMGIMASEFGALIPELRAMGERMKQRIEDRPSNRR